MWKPTTILRSRNLIQNLITKYNHWVAEKRLQGDDRLPHGDEWVGGVAEDGFRWRDGGLLIVNVGVEVK